MKVTILLAVVMLVVPLLPINVAPVIAFETPESCVLAASAGFHHPGLNGWCLTDIAIQLIFEGADPGIYY